MTRRHSLPVFAASCVAVGGLVACSGGSTDTGSGATAAPAQGPVTLKLLEYQKPRADAVEKLLMMIQLRLNNSYVGLILVEAAY